MKEERLLSLNVHSSQWKAPLFCQQANNSRIFEGESVSMKLWWAKP
jgi:hypothetical protein